MFDHIRRRLTVGYVGILALILLVFGVVVVFTFYLRASEQQDDLLLQKAEDKANSVLSGKDNYGVVKATTDYGVAVVVLLPDGSSYEDLDETSFSLGLPYRYMAQRAGQERQTIRETVPGPGGAVRVMSIPVKKYGEFGSVVAVVQAAQSRQAVSETVERLIFVLVLTGFGALVLAMAGGFFMSRRAMRPMPLSIMADHVDYLVDKLGIDGVAMGSDFDGALMPNDLSDASKLPNLFNVLRERGYDDEALLKIGYRNWVRVLRETWGM